MDVRTLISFAIVAIVLSGCETTSARVKQAAVMQGAAKASVPFPDLPESCTVKIGRVKAGGEPWVITMKRWDVVAENRDRKADDCAAWGRDMKARYEAKSQ
jgi:hypothetical protein